MSLATLISLLLPLAAAAPAGQHHSIKITPAERALLHNRFSLSSYPPQKATCPSAALVRQANSLSSQEAAYIAQRKPAADKALSAWLASVDSSFASGTLPAVGLSSSGGGFRAMLSGGGVVSAFDNRDGAHSTSGLFQGLTYYSGLSGGSWLLSSFAGNGWPTISSLSASVWQPGLENSILLSNFSLTDPTLLLIAADIAAKAAAGFEPVADDVWGRLLSKTLLNGTDGGVSDTLSGLSTCSNFTSFNVPFPIITSIGVDAPTSPTGCVPQLNATQFELTPYEFGSWDAGVDAFTPTRYLGTAVSAGVPNGSCYTGYDNLGYVLGTSSNLFNEICSPSAVANQAGGFPPTLIDLIQKLLGNVTLSNRAEYAVYPNPFEASPVANTDPLVSTASDLFLVDGGETGQNDPIWPFLQSERGLDVLIVNDNSADTSNNFPNGTEIHETYLRAQQAGLTKMPTIPDPTVFAQNLTTPRFFGCNETQAITIVYIPNTAFSFPSNQSTSKLQYSTAETQGMVANGVQIGTQNGDAEWPLCLACGIMSKTLAASGGVPSHCEPCLQMYCWS